MVDFVRPTDVIAPTPSPVTTEIRIRSSSSGSGVGLTLRASLMSDTAQACRMKSSSESNERKVGGTDGMKRTQTIDVLCDVGSDAVAEMVAVADVEGQTTG